MVRLYMLLFSLIAPALAGTGVIAVLTAGLDRLQPILVAAAVGAVLAVPVTWLVARRLA